VKKNIILLSFALLTICCQNINAQSISGFVLNEKNEPIPFVNIFVRETSSGTSSAADGKYFLTLNPGSYRLVVSAIGYENKKLEVIIGDGTLKKNIYLKSSDIALNELVVKAKRKDPAVEIIQLAIKNRDKYQSQIKSFKSDVYIKATEVVDEKERKRRAKAQVVETEDGGEALDIFGKEKSEQARKFGRISLMEVQLIGTKKNEQVIYLMAPKQDYLFQLMESLISTFTKTLSTCRRSWKFRLFPQLAELPY